MYGSMLYIKIIANKGSDTRRSKIFLENADMSNNKSSKNLLAFNP